MKSDTMASAEMKKDDGMMKTETMASGDTMKADGMMKDDAMKSDTMASAEMKKDGMMAETKAEPMMAMSADYTVKPGDSLWSIAKSELCDGAKFHDIVAANADMLGKGMMIHPGQVLHIPGD